MKKSMLLGLFAALPVMVQAAPFLTADPYPTNVATEIVPTSFVVTISGIAAPITTPAVSVGTNQVGLKLDLGPLNLTGSRTVTAKAKNAWGESASSLPFVFTAGVPAVPGSLGLSAQ
jgi:hypothetical protein